MRDENGNVNKDDIDKVLWLDEFSKSDLSDELDLNYIKIDLNSD